MFKYKNKRLLVLVLFYFLFNSLYGSHQTDSLIHIAANYFYNKPDTSIIILNQILKYRNLSIDEKAKIYHNKGIAYYYMENYSNSMRFLNKAEDIYREINDSISLSIIYNSKGLLFYQQSKYNEAINYFDKAIDIQHKKQSFENLGRTYNSIGGIYYKYKDYNRAILFFNKSKEIKTKLHDTLGVYNTITNLGLCYKEMNEYDKALSYLTQAYNYYSNNNNLWGTAANAKNIGNLFKKQDKIPQSLYWYIKAKSKILSLQNQKQIAAIYLDISDSYLKINKIDSAKLYCLKSYEIAEKNKYLSQLSESYKILSLIYNQERNYRSAYNTFKKYKQYYDSIFNIQTQEKLIDFETKYKTIEKENEILKLKKEQLLTKTKLLQQKYLLYLSLFIIVLFVFISILMHNHYKNIKKIKLTKDRLYSIVAHDLKSPFSSMKQSMKFLNNNYEKITNDAKKEMLLEMEAALENANELLLNLLNWTISEHGKFFMKKTKIKVIELFNNAIFTHQLQIKIKKIKIVKKIDDENIEILADENMMLIIIRNLLSNAIKFSDINDTVYLYANKTSKGVCIGIKDNGCGLSQEQIQEIKKNRISINRKKPGNGLGLFLVKKFLKEHKSVLNVLEDNNSLSGTNLFFYIKGTSNKDSFLRNKDSE